MCGLVGVFGDLTKEDRKQFGNMLFMDTLRGHHSTGVANVSLHRKTDVVKKAMAAYDFLDSKSGCEVIEKAGQGLLGHNRWATAGAVNTENAHPFTHGNITGMHNGTLRQQHLLPDHTRFEVDSENIMYAINRDGWEETIPKIGGAAALTWWDEESKTLNIWRNDERTLYYTITEDNKTMYWASEVGFLSVVMSKDRRKDDKKFGKIFYVKTNNHMEISFSHKDGISIKETPIEGAPKPATQTYLGGNGYNKSTQKHQAKAQTNKRLGKTTKYSLWETVQVTGLRFVDFDGKVSPYFLSGHVVGDPQTKVRLMTAGINYKASEIDEKNVYLLNICSIATDANSILRLHGTSASLKKKLTVH